MAFETGTVFFDGEKVGVVREVGFEYRDAFRVEPEFLPPRIDTSLELVLPPMTAEAAAAFSEAAARWNEDEIRRMLSLWISELEPAIVYSRDGYLLGLMAADLAKAEGGAEITIEATHTHLAPCGIRAFQLDWAFSPRR